MNKFHVLCRAYLALVSTCFIVVIWSNVNVDHVIMRAEGLNLPLNCPKIAE